MEQWPTCRRVGNGCGKCDHEQVSCNFLCITINIYLCELLIVIRYISISQGSVQDTETTPGVLD